MKNTPAIPNSKKLLVAAAVRISPTLPELTAKQRLAAMYADGELHATKDGAVWCTGCGTEFHVEGLKKGEKVTCPHCGRKEKPVFGQRKKFSDTRKYYCTLTDVREGLQVIRNFFVIKEVIRKRTFFDETYRESELNFEIHEVSQQWLSPACSHMAVIARKSFVNAWYYDLWRFDSEMAYRPKERDSHYLTGYKLPGCHLIPKARRNGIHRVNDDLNICTHIRLVMGDRIAESLQKHGQIPLLAYYCQSYRRDRMMHFWPSIQVAMRHGCHVKDVSLYLDYLQDCERLGYDMHNPKYVCISSRELQKRHRETQRRIERQRAKAETEAHKRKLLQEQEETAEYAARMQNFADICLMDGSLIIKPIMTVEDVRDEGDAMHHCVFTNEYYKELDSLLLSARVDGKRCETIEFNLRSGEVEQSRAFANGVSEWHDEILSLMSDNSARIMAISNKILKV